MIFFPLRLACSRLGIAALLILSGCAAANQPASVAGEEDFHDPYENLNRSIFDFNQSVDRNVILPVAKAYRDAVPEPLRDRVQDFSRNLRGPVIFANDALQGDLPRAGDTLARFALNSTIGIAGLVDVAGGWGLPYHDEDFGLTLAVWGVGEGPYLVIPILGPSNPRDAVGSIAEGFADPWDKIAEAHGRFYMTIVRALASGIDMRSRYIETLADLERTSLDYYATIRSLYRQRRAALIRHEQENLPPNPSFGQGGGPAAAPSVVVNPRNATAVISEASPTSEVSP
jgi:phospholipid-binding lipoprotein MlaA